MPVPSSTPLSRRGALAAGAAALATGCDLDPRADPAVPTPTAPTSAPPGGRGDPGKDADLKLLDEARTGVAAALALVEAARDRHPSLRGSLRPLAVVHRVHARELATAGRDVESTDDAGRQVRGDPTRALARVRAHEERLQRELTAAAVRSYSGGFARLLGMLAASVAQHLATLPAGPGA